jgi:hypothetical protein
MARRLSNPGIAMFLSFLSALAVGLVLLVTLLTVVIPFVMGFFGRRDLP